MSKMLEAIVKFMFGGSCLLLAAVFLRKDLFLTPDLEHTSKSKPTLINHQANVACTTACQDDFRAGLERSVNQWDPILISFLVNQRGVNVALASSEDFYLQLKALEFCTENAAVLQLQSLEQLERECAMPVLSVFRSKLENGDFLRPIARPVLTLDNTTSDMNATNSAEAPSTTPSHFNINDTNELSFANNDKSEVEKADEKEHDFNEDRTITAHEEILAEDKIVDLLADSADELVVSDDGRNEIAASTLSTNSAPVLLEEELKLNVESEESPDSVPVLSEEELKQNIEVDTLFMDENREG